ncbi:MAG: hypothetical protein OEZ48_08660 [Candidatus Bathyarchaeota archaeon]|nr:hypothetical protein [Candidatus Bathyarchaeota archaeon]
MATGEEEFWPYMLASYLEPMMARNAFGARWTPMVCYSMWLMAEL